MLVLLSSYLIFNVELIVTSTYLILSISVLLLLFFQQADDPPFLSVGTDVSAKYKGAFCEAKIKKVVRNIKCKVTYKSLQF